MGSCARRGMFEGCVQRANLLAVVDAVVVVYCATCTPLAQGFRVQHACVSMRFRPVCHRMACQTYS